MLTMCYSLPRFHPKTHLAFKLRILLPLGGFDNIAKMCDIETSSMNEILPLCHNTSSDEG